MVSIATGQYSGQLYHYPTASSVGAAVLDVLLPVIKEIKEDINNLNELYSNMSEAVVNLEKTVKEHKNQTSSELADLQSSIESSMKEHVNSELVELQINQGNIDSKIDSLESQQDDLSMKMMRVASELEENLLNNIKKRTTEDFKQSPEVFMAHMWRRRRLETCGYLDMTDPTTTCPSGWQLTGHSKRTCGIVHIGRRTCDSVFFPVTGGQYTRVCGTIRGYQYQSTDAFEAYHKGEVSTIEGAYVAGVSLTHGIPRQHIWTFAGGNTPTRDDVCPCDATIPIAVPPFVGGDYFCESGANTGHGNHPHYYDPLWDGRNCTSTSRCCSFNNPPYFTKQLSSPTTDDMEARMCQYDSGEYSPIEFIEGKVDVDSREILY